MRNTSFFFFFFLLEKIFISFYLRLKAKQINIHLDYEKILIINRLKKILKKIMKITNYPKYPIITLFKIEKRGQINK